MKQFVHVLLGMVILLLASTPSTAQQCCTGNVSTYCTAGTSVLGCLPSISSTGTPSVDAGSGFQVAVANLPGQRFGTIFYGFFSYITPWAPGSPSFKCVASPVQRTGSANTGATAASCNGALNLDFNQWIAGNPNALGAPFLQGQTIRAQAWYRDPAAPGQTSLSDALAFTLCSGVGDTTPPVIMTCAANQTVAGNASCQAIVPDFTAGIIATDNCSAVTVTQSPAAGISISVGVHLIALWAHDASGNSNYCAAKLTVVDTAPPVISVCPSNQVVAANGACQAVVPDFTASTIVTDACSNIASVTQSPPLGTVVNYGDWPVVITATDSYGNASLCSATLIVVPSGPCPAPVGFVAISPGAFQMGSGQSSNPPYFNSFMNQPVHQVTISYPYWIGATEVTQSQYQTLMGYNPSTTSFGPQNPVETVSWGEARAYCQMLTVQQLALGNVPGGHEFRLPTEAEWEYACRSGTATEFNVGNAIYCHQAQMQYSYHSSPACSTSNAVAVGSFPPSPWGIFDMHGNVAEWCLDSYAPYSGAPLVDPFVTGGSIRIWRGGSYADASSACRSAAREANGTYAPNYVGFRVVLGPIRAP
jgi:formylglycine-generating enzyme required for sulfatase activity